MLITTTDEGVLLIRLREGKVASTEEPLPEVFVDLDAAGEVLSIEVVGAEEVSASDLIKVFQQFGLDQKLVLAA